MAQRPGARGPEYGDRWGEVGQNRRNKREQGWGANRPGGGKGIQLHSGLTGSKARTKADANWDREVAVMVGSVVNNLGR